MKQSIPTTELYTQLSDLEARANHFARLGNLGKFRSLKAECETLQIRICHRERESELYEPIGLP